MTPVQLAGDGLFYYQLNVCKKELTPVAKVN